MEAIEEKTLHCYHCGEQFDSQEAIQHDEKVFCCTGCKTVYEILNDADLCDFYNLEERTGKVRNSDTRKYLALESEEIAKDFIDFANNGIAKVTFFTPDIHCSSCIWLLEHLNRINAYVLRSHVNFLKREVSITYNEDELSLKEIAYLLDSIGYPPKIEGKKRTNKKDNSGKSLVIRLAVAGFCFGNSMLMSLPEYLDLDYQIPENYRTYFGYINLLFALPVFFYSSSVYFKSAWKGLKHKFINIDVPISIGVITLFVRSLIEILFLGGGGFVDSLAGLVFFLLIGRWYQHKTYQALSFDRDFNSYFPVAVTRLIEGKEELVRLESLQEGDEIMLRNNELIPADGILIEGSGNIDYSFVTGESVPSPHSVEDQLYAGGRQLGGPITIRLTKTVNNSHLTKLWNSNLMEEDQDQDLNNISDQISRYFTAAILILALLSAVVWVNIDASKAVNVFTSILIVACPCALALSVPFSYGHTLRVFGKHGFYLKNANIIEKIARIKTLVFDKTGTLTKTLPEDVKFVGKELNDFEKRAIYSTVSNSVHPLSKIVRNHLYGTKKITLTTFEELPGSGIEASLEGIQIRLGSKKWITGQKLEEGDATQTWVTINGNLLGYFEFSNAYRDGIFDSLDHLSESYTLHLLSGDNDGENQRLAPYFSSLHFNRTPEDKLSFIADIKKSSSVMMVGDGLNDAGALKNSDVGISISDDVYQFSPACDGILDASKLKDFTSFLQFSRTALKIVYVAFAVSFLYNIVGLSFAILGKLTPLVSSILMPLSSVTVVLLITILVNWKMRSIFKIKK